MFLIRTCFISRLCRHSPKYFLINKICANLCSVDVPVVHKGLRSPTQDGPKEYPANILKIAEEIASLTLLEVAELNELLAKKLNIKVSLISQRYFLNVLLIIDVRARSILSCANY